jgi:hypothetical protein
MMPRYYLKFLGGTAEVDDLIGVSPSNHGTSNPGAQLAEGLLACVSRGQRRAGSARCPLDFSEHLGIIYDPVALRWIKNALGRPGPADPAFRPSCL